MSAFTSSGQRPLSRVVAVAATASRAVAATAWMDGSSEEPFVYTALNVFSATFDAQADERYSAAASVIDMIVGVGVGTGFGVDGGVFPATAFGDAAHPASSNTAANKGRIRADLSTTASVPASADGRVPLGGGGAAPSHHDHRPVPARNSKPSSIRGRDVSCAAPVT